MDENEQRAANNMMLLMQLPLSGGDVTDGNRAQLTGLFPATNVIVESASSFVSGEKLKAALVSITKLSSQNLTSRLKLSNSGMFSNGKMEAALVVYKG